MELRMKMTKLKKEGARHKEENKQSFVNKEGGDIEQLKPIIASSHVDVEGSKVSDEDIEHKKSQMTWWFFQQKRREELWRAISKK